MKVGAVPTKLANGEPATVNIFASDLATLGAARFACLAESCTLPESGTRAVRLEVGLSMCSSLEQYRGASESSAISAHWDLGFKG